ncbi:unnamed protein product [Effrenium voratum]|nr:unnamed protein product [Effrenium voratum]
MGGYLASGGEEEVLLNIEVSAEDVGHTDEPGEEHDEEADGHGEAAGGHSEASGGHGEESEEGQELTLSEESLAAAGIRIEVLAPVVLGDVVTGPAEIQANAYRSSIVTPRIPAIVVERHVRLSDTVEAGEPLVTLFSRDVADAEGEPVFAVPNEALVRSADGDWIIFVQDEEATMLNSIIDLGIRGRLLVVLALAAATVGGFLVLPGLNLDAFPDVTNVQVSINTEARGLASEEVEQLITYPIEAVMYALPDVQEVRSISKTGLSVITVVFQEGTDIYFARQLVFERLQAAMDQIPDGVGTPEMGPNTSGLGQIFQYVLRAEEPGKFDIKTLRSLNDWVVKLLLMPVDGVTDVLSFGGDVLQYQVNIDPQKLLSYGLTVDEVRGAIEASNRNSGGWYLDRGAEQLVIRGVGWVRSGDDGLRDIGNVPLKEEDGFVVSIADVADVSLGGEIRQGATTLTIRDEDGNAEPLGEVVLGVVLKRLGANTKGLTRPLRQSGISLMGYS